jgi:hypothetical protein
MARHVVAKPGAARCLRKGLSCVMENYHARPISEGGDGAVMRCLYPAIFEKSVRSANSVAMRSIAPVLERLVISSSAMSRWGHQRVMPFIDGNLSNPNWTDLARDRACQAGSFTGLSALALFLI